MLNKTVTIDELRVAIPLISKQDSKNPNHHITPIIQSEAGCGKTSILSMIEEDLGDGYDYIYVDCPVMDYSDVQMTIPDKETGQLKPYTGSMWKMDSPKPKVILLDEFMKAPKMLQIMFTRLMLERTIGDTPLPDGSIVFGTSNNENEGLGDGMLAHARNRCCILQMKKPNAEEWLSWANNNNINPYIKAFVDMTPKCFASYRDEGQEDNPYIYNPKKPQLAFASPRSIAKLSVIIDNKDVLGTNATLNAMEGTVGASFAGDFQAVLGLEKQLPRFTDILKNPEQVEVPDNIQAQMILMFQATDKIKSQEDCSNFMKFVKRIPHNEVQAMFFSMVLKNKNTVGVASRNKDITQWATANSFMYKEE